jgi:hypothetical protein
VGVKKKSFCGSLSDDKPCLHIDFGTFSEANEPAGEMWTKLLVAAGETTP